MQISNRLFKGGEASIHIAKKYIMLDWQLLSVTQVSREFFATFINATQGCGSRSTKGCVCETYRATPTIKLLERRRASGSAGSVIRPQSWMISAPITSRFGNFLNEDLAPRVAASLPTILVQRARVKRYEFLLPQKTKPTITSGQQL